MISRFLFLGAFFFTVVFPMQVYAFSSDLGISASNIHFSEDDLYAGETVRLYATVRNHGVVDVSAKVIFYQGAVLIGSSQMVSVLADGGSDDVYVDYRIPRGTFNIRAVIQGQDPVDENPANNEAITGLFTSILDADRDGVLDQDDNCENDGNPDQADADVDGMGDVCDADPYPQEEPRGNNVDAAMASNASQSEDMDQYANAQTRASDAPLGEVIPAPSVGTVLTSTPSSEVFIAADDVNIQAPAPSPGLFGFGILAISPHAQFSYRQLDWRTYEFQALQSEGKGSVTYAWDFGDGATSMQQSLTHAFPDAGHYVVTLAVLDEGGAFVSDAQMFDVSFFHLRNPWIQGTLAVLFFALLALIWLVLHMRSSRSTKHDLIKEDV